MRIRAYADLHLFKDKETMNRYISEELNDLVMKLMDDPPDMLIFAGDLTHTSYQSDDIRFLETIKFITKVVTICETNKIYFRMIQGTASHDGKIVEMLKTLFIDSKYCRFFTSVAYEDFNGYIIRYLPESYFGTYSEFQSYAFDKPADMTFFHGSVDGVIPYVKQKDSITNLPKSIVIQQKDLINNTRLFSAGGHIHQHINLQDKIFYINSLTTMSFSDIDNIKGYMEFTLDKYDWDWIYVPNYNAPKYLDFIIENIHMKPLEEMKSILSNLLLKVSSKDYIRFTITGERNSTGLANLSLLKTYVKKYNIKIKTEMNDTELEEKLTDDINYYTDKSVSNIDKIKRLASDLYGVDLEDEEIERMIFNDNK